MSVYTGEVREWFVSEAGTDNTTCGTTYLTPCRRMDSAVLSARPGDVLRLDPASAPYRLPCTHPDGQPDQVFTLQSLTIAAVNSSGRPTIVCETAPDTAERCALSLDNVTMLGVDLGVDNCRVTIFNTYLLDSTVYTTRTTCRSLRMRMTRTNWTFSGHLPCSRVTSRSNVSEPCRQTLVNELSCVYTDVTLDRVRLVLGSLIIYRSFSTHIYVTESQFTGDPDNPQSQFLGGLHMTFSAIDANITIVNCVFSNQAST